MATAAAALCIPLFGLLFAATPATAQAPYPPGEPCAVSATSRGPVTTDGLTDYDVVGSGLGSAQPVRVLLATNGQQVGAARTDEFGSFRTVVSVVTTPASASNPGFTVSSPQQTCSSPTASPPRVPPAPGTGSGAGSNGESAGGSGSGNSVPDGPPTGSGGSTDTNAGSRTSTGPRTSTTPGYSSTSTSSSGNGAGSSPAPVASAPPAPSDPALAQPLRGSDTPLGIGLAIAAMLLVLGTLAVLLMTRRSER